MKKGAAAGHPGMFWDGEKWVSSEGGATYANGVFFATGGKYSRDGGPTFPPLGTGATIFAHGGPVASFYVDGNGYPTPFAMNPGSGKGGGMLQDYASEHLETGGFVGRNGDYVKPFAMYAGSGQGGGMLEEYAAETMKRGGAHKGKKKLTPQQMQMMMAAMGQQGAPPGGGAVPMIPPGSGAGQMMAPQGMVPQGGQPMDPSMQQQPMMMAGGKPCLECGGAYNYGGMAYEQFGGMPDDDGDVDIMKSGGNWIKGAVNPKHKGYCTPMTKPTCTPRRKAFAMTMKKHHGFHHKEYGGEVTQGGNVVRDNEMYANGGMYHPLAKFMAEGGPNFAQHDDFDPNDPSLPPVGNTTSPAFDPAATGVVQPPPDPAASAPWRQGMTDEQAQQNINYGAGSTEAYDPETGNTDNGPGSINGKAADQNRSTGWNKFYNGSKIAFGTLGAGLAVASAYNNLADERRMAGYRRSLGTSDNIAKVNQPGGKGDWDQYGNFRPNQNTPVRPGMYYPMGSNAPVTQYGGTFAMGGRYSQDGGMYHAGQELELSDAEIARLRGMGYKIDIL
jgi:hypothetical protein